MAIRVHRQIVLIVDDEPANIEVLNEILQDDYQVLFATNGPDALMIATGHLPDIILLDIMMPEMSGYEVCTQLKEDPELNDIPVIFITAMAGEKDETTGLELGAADYITKPVNPTIVHLRVKNQLELKQHRDRLEYLVKQRTMELYAAKNAAEAGNHAKSEFLMTISHELRTPLNSIIGFSEVVLGSKSLDDSDKESLYVVLEAGKKLLSLVDDVLLFINTKKRNNNQSVTSYDLSELFQDLSETLSDEVEKKGLSLVNDISPDILAPTYGDATILRTVLLNLLKNAVIFTKNGSIELRVEKESDPERGDRLHFSVKDTGVGIPEEKQCMIFQQFTQGESVITRSHSGLGLGLAICTRFVQLLGGKLWLESQVDQGSTFHFDIPLLAPPEEEK